MRRAPRLMEGFEGVFGGSRRSMAGRHHTRVGHSKKQAARLAKKLNDEGRVYLPSYRWIVREGADGAWWVVEVNEYGTEWTGAPYEYLGRDERDED